jgi:hypothetical protein
MKQDVYYDSTQTTTEAPGLMMLDINLSVKGRAIPVTGRGGP